MDPNTEEMDEKKIAYEASKRYVLDKYPEFGEIFDEMWNLSVSNSKKQPASSPDLKKDVGGLNFVWDNSVGQIITIALPFISGVVSSILSEIILQKTRLKSKETAKMAEDKAERIRISLNVSKETADEMLPYILSAIAQVSADVKKSKQYNIRPLYSEDSKLSIWILGSYGTGKEGIKLYPHQPKTTTQRAGKKTGKW